MEAGYDGLSAAEEARLDELMTMRAGDWPDGLRRWVNDQKCTSGDTVVDAVGKWLKMQRYSA